MRKDLPDLCRFMLVTGVRIGETLAVLWSDVDHVAGAVWIDHTMPRVEGRSPTKAAAGEWTLRLPSSMSHCCRLAS